jgi:hypothetical protein
MNRRDLTGEVFGRLMVKEYVNTDAHGRAMWRCLCECGAEPVIAGKSMTGGRTKSCGCYRREVAPFNKEQSKTRCLPGARFGMLVLGEVVDRKWGSALWRCACDCGGSREVVASVLRKGQAMHCGCQGPAKRGPKPKPKAEKPAKQRATRVRAADRKPSQQIGAWPKTAPKKKVGPADSRPAWRPQSEYKPLSEPAQPAAGPLVRVLPGWTHDPRYQLAPGERVLGGFATAGIGRYIGEVAA